MTTSLDILNIFLAFVYWYWFKNSYMDLISFIVNSLVFGVHFLTFFRVIGRFGNVKSREAFYVATMYNGLAILFWWPFVWLVYVIHGYWMIATYPSYMYIAVKHLLYAIYNFSMFFVWVECIFPIYNWWYTLDQLQEKVEYTRPTEA